MRPEAELGGAGVGSRVDCGNDSGYNLAPRVLAATPRGARSQQAAWLEQPLLQAKGVGREHTWPGWVGHQVYSSLVRRAGREEPEAKGLKVPAEPTLLALKEWAVALTNFKFRFTSSGIQKILSHYFME